jgi:SsrA-binding protein
MPILATNKRANFDYEILDKYEAGIVLLGHEVKAVRAGNVSLAGSYVTLQAGFSGSSEAYLINAHISLYKQASNIINYEPTRSRKLLLNKNEIERLLGKKQEKGLTLVPLNIYTKNSFLKLQLGVARGKKKYDKRDDIKKKDLDRDRRRLLKGERLD